MLVLNKKSKCLHRWIAGLFAYALIATYVLCGFSALSLSAYELPKQTIAFYVNDVADLLSKETEDYIVGTVEDLYDKTSAQVVVVTVNSLEDASIEAYATDLFRTYGIGDKEKNNGVLILLALEERECRIEVGYGLEGAIPDGKAGRILDNYMIPYLAEDQWDEGIHNGFDAVIDEICKEYDVEVTHNEPKVVGDSDSGSFDAETKIYLGMVIICVFIALISNSSGSGGGGYRSYGGGRSGGGFNFGGGGSSGGGGASRKF